MKLFLISFFLFLFFVSEATHGGDFQKDFTVKVSGIKIGSLNWEIRINETEYSNRLRLKSEGLLSKIYQFEGDYYSEGVVINNKLIAQKYNHLWKTKKIEKNMKLIFQDGKLDSLNQTPYEKEK